MTPQETETEMLKHGIEDSEKLIRNAVDIAFSVDRKSNSLLGIYVAISTAIVGSVFALQSEGKLEPVYLLFSIPTAILFLFGTACCFYAAIPRTIYSPGHLPDAWIEAIDENIDYSIFLRAKLEMYRSNIERNRLFLNKKVKYYKMALTTGLLSPFLLAILTISYFEYFLK